MTTVVNTPPTKDSDAGIGWAVAVIILIAVICAGVYLFYFRGATPAPAQPNNAGASINVTLPGTVGEGDTEEEPAP